METYGISYNGTLDCTGSLVDDSDIISISDCNWHGDKEIYIPEDCTYKIKCEKNIPIPAFENKNIEDLLKIFSAKEIIACKNNLTYEEEEKLKLILELSK